MKNGLKTLAMWLIIGIIFMVLIVSIVDNSDTKMSYSDLLMKIESGEVTEMEVASDGKKALVTLKGITGQNINLCAGLTCGC